MKKTPFRMIAVATIALLSTLFFLEPSLASQQCVSSAEAGPGKWSSNVTLCPGGALTISDWGANVVGAPYCHIEITGLKGALSIHWPAGLVSYDDGGFKSNTSGSTFKAYYQVGGEKVYKITFKNESSRNLKVSYVEATTYCTS